MKLVGKPDAGNRHVRFDERGRETECCHMAQATAPVLDSTAPGKLVRSSRWKSGPSKGSARLVASVAWPLATVVAKRTQ